MEALIPKKTVKKRERVYNVKPLRSQLEIEDMKDSLRRWCGERDRYMFILGINSGLRISDIIRHKVGDIRKATHFSLIEQKSGKSRIVYVKEFIDDTEAYTKGMSDDEWLFPSRKGNGHITTTQAYRTLVKAGEMIDRQDIGTHTMRKTFGYHYYKRTKDVATLQEIFNHSHPKITLRYIGIIQDEIDKSLEGFRL